MGKLTASTSPGDIIALVSLNGVVGLTTELIALVCLYYMIKKFSQLFAIGFTLEHYSNVTSLNLIRSHQAGRAINWLDS